MVDTNWPESLNWPTKERNLTMPTTETFSHEFTGLCQRAGVPATMRQWRKYQRGEGAAYAQQVREAVEAMAELRAISQRVEASAKRALV